LKGRYHFYKFTAQSLEKGKEYYEHALAIDPNYALAWGALAQLYKVIGFLGLKPPKESNAQSSQAALRALELDEKLPIAHAMIGALRALDYDWRGAEREFCWAIELDPESEDVLGEYCVSYLAPTRRLDEALALWRRAVESDPLSPFRRRLCGCLYYLMRQYDHAIEECNNALELDSGNIPARQHMGQTYIAMGRFHDAIRILESAGAPASLAFAYAKAGQISEAQKILEELKGLAKKTYVSYLNFAIIRLGLGEIDSAFDWLDRAIDAHEGMILTLPVQPLYDPLRSHPRYHALLRKMNLEA
jgi:tetratricopeptide (TPR) repeat protein